MTTITKTNMHTGRQAAEKSNEIKLASSQVYRINHRRGELNILAVRGTLWVTSQGDPTDHVLQPGQQLPVSSRGTVVVEAMTDACLRLQ